MKKLLSLLIVVGLVATALTGCAPKTYKVGYGTVMSVSGSAAAADADGKYGVNVTIASVTLDKDGKFVNVALDVAQASNLKFDATGALTTDLTTYALKTKQEKGADYGMKGASAIGKEWNEQANAFAAWAVGKTVEDVKALVLDEEGKATDADVLAGTTVHVSEFVEALEKAAAADADGKYGVNVTIANVALDKDGKFVNVALDVAQASNLKFDATGALKTDLATYALKTKQEKGAEYGMKGASAIGKEWNEQANAFAAWCVGKTIEDVKALALDAEGNATDADVLAGTTVHVSEFVEALVKAVDASVALTK